jgi:hypothetical protein
VGGEGVGLGKIEDGLPVVVCGKKLKIKKNTGK